VGLDFGVGEVEVLVEAVETLQAGLDGSVHVVVEVQGEKIRKVALDDHVVVQENHLKKKGESQCKEHQSLRA